MRNKTLRVVVGQKRYVATHNSQGLSTNLSDLNVFLKTFNS